MAESELAAGVQRAVADHGDRVTVGAHVRTQLARRPAGAPSATRRREVGRRADENGQEPRIRVAILGGALQAKTVTRTGGCSTENPTAVA